MGKIKKPIIKLASRVRYQGGKKIIEKIVHYPSIIDDKTISD